MFSTALRIAIARASTPEELQGLENILAKADALGRIEAAFETRINESKAARGEGPTRLSRAKREQLGALADDQAALQAEQLAAFEASTSASEIVIALKAGLRADLQFWSGAAKHTHPSDLPVVEEFVSAKRELLAAMNDFLKD